MRAIYMLINKIVKLTTIYNLFYGIFSYDYIKDIYWIVMFLNLIFWKIIYD
jgi:hypothetical protein